MLINILYIIIINKSILNLIINVLNMHNIKKYREYIIEIIVAKIIIHLNYSQLVINHYHGMILLMIK